LIAEENEFAAALKEGASRAELEIRLTRLIQAFQSHFRSEEGLMRLNGFPGLELHAVEHRRLITQMSGLRDDLGSGVVKLCDALIGFIRLWREQHIAGPDDCFMQFVNQKAAGSRPRLFSFAQEPGSNPSSL
jgi:hemerythrin-like metal-binding protein